MYRLHWLTGGYDTFPNKGLAFAAFKRKSERFYVFVIGLDGKVIRSNCSLRPVT